MREVSETSDDSLCAPRRRRATEKNSGDQPCVDDGLLLRHSPGRAGAVMHSLVSGRRTTAGV